MRPGLFFRRGWLLTLGLASGLAASPLLAGPGEVLLRLRSGPGTDSVLARGAMPSAFDAFRARHPELTELAVAEWAPLLPRGRSAAAARGALPPNPIARTVLVRMPPESDADAVARRLRALPEVELAVPNRTLVIGPIAVPPPVPAPPDSPSGPTASGGGDPRRSEQWYLDRVGAGPAWAVTRGTPDVLIAIVDTGVSQHPDLTPSFWPNDDPPGNANLADDGIDQDGSGAVEDWERADDDDNGYVDDQYGYDFVDAPRIGGPGDAVERDPDPADDSGHGTAVAGVVGAAAENGIGIAGLAPGCRLMIVRAGFNPGIGLFSGVLEEDDAAAAIVYAAENGAQVINLSFGDTVESPIVSDAVAYARALGALIVASGGNEGSDGPHFPSALPGVVAVGASNFADERAAFSNYGPGLDLVAPGESILTTAFEDDYVALAGTSFSAPLVAAAAALLLSHEPTLAPSQVEAALWGTAKDVGFLGFDLATGHGRLDGGQALAVPRAGSVAILAPAAGSAVDRSAPIVVTAEGLGLESYVIEAGAGREPAEFTPVHAASGVQVVADTVATWDASGLAAGEYTLRLRAMDAYEGVLETRTLVEVDHTPPVVSELAVELLWVEDRLTPFIFFATDDLARGSIAIDSGAAPDRTVTGAYRTREHTLRFPDDLPPGVHAFAASAVNAAGLGTGPAAGVAPVGAQRAMTHALAPTGRALPPGEVAPRARDLDQDGAEDLVLMLEMPGQTFGPLAVFGDSSGTLVERARLPQALLPRDVGDSDGDGRGEILASGPGTAVLLESPGPGTFPQAPVWEDPSGFAIGFASLAGTPVILGIRSDSLLVWRATGDASNWVRSAHANFAAPGASLGPTFFAGDVDGDGADEVVMGDGEGNLLAFRETAAGLVPGYHFALPDAASPLVAGGDLDLDGRPEVVASVAVGLDSNSEAAIDRRRHALLVITADPQQGFEVIADVRVAGAEGRGNGLRAANLDSDPEPEIVFLAAPDLYVFDRGAGGTYFPIDLEPGFRSLSLGLADLDADGRTEVFATAGDQVRELEARDPSLPGPPPPAGIRARIAADGAIEIAWNPAPNPADRFRLYRAGGKSLDCATTPLLAEVAAASHRDTTAGALPVVAYRVSQVSGGVEGECSAPVVVTREEAPRLLGAAADGPRGVRVLFSATMDGSASELGSYALVGPTGAPVRLSSVISVAGERGRTLVLDRDLAPGRHGLRVGEVRSLAGGVLAGPDSLAFEVTPPPPATPLHLVRAVPQGEAAVRVELSAPAEPVSGSDPASFHLAGGFTIAEAAVESTLVTLTLDPATPLRPGAFVLELGAGLRGARGERVVPGEGDRTELVVGGELVVYPNPYDAGRASGSGVTFAGLAAGDEIVLLDALGREISRLDASPRGTAYLTVRGRPEFASGVYLFRVEGPGGVKFGKLAIRR